MRKIVFLLLILIFSIPGSYAQQININARVDSHSIYIGNRFHYFLEINHQNGLDVAIPAPDDTLGAFEILDRIFTDTSRSGGMIRKKIKYILTSFQPGDQVVPSLKISYRLQGDSAFKTIETDTFLVSVKAVPLDTASTPLPIKGPIEAPFSWQEFLPYIIGGILLFLAIIALFLIFRKRKRRIRPDLIVNEPVEDPFHRAKRKLRDLGEEKVWQEGNHKEFQDRLSDILRELLERKYGVPALEMTTPEIRSGLERKNFPSAERTPLIKILEFADLVKFAKVLPGPSENEGALREANEIVERLEKSE